MTGVRQGNPGWKPGQSGNPKGRPAGTFAVSRKLSEMLDADGGAELIRTKLIEAAKTGDMAALTWFADRLWPRPKSTIEPIRFQMPHPASLVEKAEAVLQAAADGLLPPDVASQMISALGTVARLREIDELAARLDAIEMKFPS